MDNQQLIFIPLIAQVFLVFLVWIWMYKTRITEIRKQSINPQLLANSSDAMKNLKNVSGSSANFKNLFEIPVLFYIAIIVIYVTKIANILYLYLAATFVIHRYVHSFIHVTYNREN